MKDILEEAQVSIANPIIVIPSVTYLGQCILCFCFSFGLGFVSFIFRLFRLPYKVEGYHYPFIVVAIFFIINMAILGCSLYIIRQLNSLSGKQQWNAQLAKVIMGDFVN